MGNSVIAGEFQHLRIDHDEFAAVRRQAVDQRQDHGVDRHRLARAGGAGDQQMGHAGEIDDHRRAADILAQHQRQLRRRALVILRRQELAQPHGLADAVGQLDADDALAGDHRDAHRD
jgi:hypothetical protein